MRFDTVRLSPALRRLALPAILAAAAFAAPGGAAAYQNPISLPNAYELPDPCMIRYMGKYYMYGTKVTGNGINCWESTDLVNWTHRGAVTPSSPQHQWAPDVFYYNGTFYMYISNQGHQHYVLTSSSPTGPFSIVRTNWCPSIDGSAFMDDNGQMWFSWASPGGITYRPMSNPLTLTGSAVKNTACMINVDPGNTWTEASQIFKINGTYFINYSGNHFEHANYQVHAGRGTSVAGLAGQGGGDRVLLSQTTGTYTGTAHNFVALGPDLQTYYTVYHAATQSPNFHRVVCLDRVYVDSGTGNLKSSGPTFNAQPNPTLPAFSDDFNRTTIGPDWTNAGGGNWGIYNSMLMYGDNRGSTAWAREYSAGTTGSDYVIEFNTKMVNRGTSAYAKYGVFVSNDPGNEFSVWIDPTANLVATHGKVNGVAQAWVNSPALRSDWNEFAWHPVRVEKRGSQFKVFVDNLHVLTRTMNIGGGKFGMTLEDCHADFGWTGYSNIASDIVVDNAGAGFSASSNWVAGSSSTDKYGSNYQFHSTTAVSDAATWTYDAPQTRNYEIYAWWPQGSNRSTTAPYIVSRTGGTTTVQKNQQVNGGSWQSLGIFPVTAGTNTVKLSCWTTAGYVVVADAVKIVPR